MSVLEFISSLKWPVTLLILAVGLGRWWHRSPDARASFREWIANRDIRLHLGGQELEATLADTTGSMAAAAASDEQISALAHEPGGPEVELEELLRWRRDAVEDVMRSAALWGFELGKSGVPRLPATTVTWSENGEPSINIPAWPTHWDLVGQERALLHAMAQRPGQPLSTYAQEVGISTRLAHSMAQSLEQRGHLVQRSRGRWAVLRRTDDLPLRRES
ncbi:hypothetical protein [Actinacidiphila acidipaludis]|uniref:HTH marR-type domain-containing protein n=1 Tax=Actinacidiphila acidipaludis TaxID=2873382 RepID=A0ABS7QFV9_9ACTN|nr:hypothetical protein [Streptomyces acidipaludis]MBY8882042.1 hypothetical protein [Streptomyces acidipaludis]